MKIYSIVLFSVMFVVSAAAAETTVFSENFDGTNLSANENQEKKDPQPGIEIVSERAFSAPNSVRVWIGPKSRPNKNENFEVRFPNLISTDRDVMIRFKVWLNDQSGVNLSLLDPNGRILILVHLRAIKSPQMRHHESWRDCYGITPLPPEQWLEFAICIGSKGKKFWLVQIDKKGKRIDGGTVFEYKDSQPRQISGLKFYDSSLRGGLEYHRTRGEGIAYFDDITVTTADSGTIQPQEVAHSLMMKNLDLEVMLATKHDLEVQRKKHEESEKAEKEAKIKQERENLNKKRFIKIKNQCARPVKIINIKTFDKMPLSAAEYSKYMNLPIVINAKEIKEIGLPQNAEMLIITLEGSDKQFAPEAKTHDEKAILEETGRIPVWWFNHIIIQERDSKSAIRDFQVLFNTEMLWETHEKTKEEIARDDAFRKAEMDLQRLHMMLSGKSPWQKVILETVSGDVEKLVLKTGGEWEKFIARLAELRPTSFNSDDMGDEYKKESLLKALSAVSPHVSAEAQQNIQKLKGLLKKKDYADEFRRARDARFQRRAGQRQGDAQSERAFRQAARELFFLRVASSQATSGWRKVILDSVSGDMRNPTLKTSGEWEIFIARLAELPSGSFASDLINDFDKERLLKSFSIVSPYVSEDARNNIRKLKELFDQSEQNAGSGATAKGLPPGPQLSPDTATSPGNMGMTDSQILSIQLQAPNMQLKMLLKRIRKKPEDTVFHQTIIAFMENKDGDSLKTKEEWEALVYTLNALPKEAFSKVPIVEKSFLKSILSLIKHHVSSSAQDVISQLENRI